MLAPQYRWIDAANGSFLHWNYGCVAYTSPDGDRWRTVVRWAGREIHGWAGSRAQAKRWLTRFYAVRGMPMRR